MKQKSYDRQQQLEQSINACAPNDANSNGANSDGVTLDEPVSEGDAIFNLLLDDESEDEEEETTTGHISSREHRISETVEAEEETNKALKKWKA